VIADDHALVREGVRAVLEAEDGFHVVGEAPDGASALRMVQQLRPDVLLLDLTMPSLGGLELLAMVRERVPHTRVIVLSIHDHPEYVAHSIRGGASGYLLKDSDPAELRRAVRTVYGGGSCFFATELPGPDPGKEGRGTESPRARLSATLTLREREVLIQIATGHSNKGIAAALGISVRTVESHRETMMRKLGIRGTASLTKFAIDAGLVRDEARE